MTTSALPQWLETNLQYPLISMAGWAPSMAAMYGDRPAIIEGDRVCTYTELDQRCAQFAGALVESGVQPGDVVLLHLGNCTEFLIAYYGALRAGAAVTLVNPLQPEAGLRRQIEETGAVAAITQPQQLDTLLRASADTTVGLIAAVSDEPVIADSSVVQRFDDLTAAQPTSFEPVRVSGDDVAHIAYTGGTTGVSKGVRVLQRNVVGNVTQMCAWRSGHQLVADADGRVWLEPLAELTIAGVTPAVGSTIVISPLFHAHALINTSFLLVCGLTQVLSGRFDPTRMLAQVERYEAAYLTGSPAMWHALVTHPDIATRDLSSVRVVSSGAAPIDRVTLESLERFFPNAMVADAYGLTEATCVVTARPLVAGLDRRVGSAGLPVFDTEVQIRDRLDRSVVLADGERGELWVRGPQVTDGYLGQPEITAEQYVDGWLATGDIAHRDADGFVYIADRAKDMLIYKGYNVYPRELEEILVSHPAISVAAVVGREAGAAGQEPVAFVVASPRRTIDAEQLKDFVAEQVLPYKKLRDVVVVDSLPTSAAGKILKAELRKLVAR